MALTKVSGGILDPGINVAGIVTATGFDGPFTGGSTKNITAGIITATGFDLNGNGDISGNLVIGGNLTANGDFTTLNTTLREVEILRVDANTTATAGIITQRGSGDILNLYDDSTEVFSVADGGGVTLSSTIDVTGQSTFRDRLQLVDGTPEILLSVPSGGLDSRILNDGSGNLIIGHGANSDTPTEVLRIKPGGEVGINSSSPREKLEVLGNANIIVDNNKGIKLGYRGESKTAYIGLDANDAANAGSQSWANSAYIGFYSDGSSERSITYRTSAGSHIFQGVNGTEFVRITSDGYVGIGVTNPEDYSSGGKNLVVGSSGQEGITIRSSSPNTGNLLFNDGLNLIAGISFKHDSTASNRYFSFNINNGSSYVEQLRLQDGKLIFSNDQNSYISGGGDTFKFTTGGTERVRINGSGNLKLPDAAELQFGGALHTGNGDLKIFHDSSATNNVISGHTGSLNIRNYDTNSTSINLSARNNILLQTNLNETAIQCLVNGAVEIFHDGGTYTTPKLRTLTTGIQVTGDIGSSSTGIGNVYLADDKSVYLGNGQDVRLLYDSSGSASFTIDSQAGYMYINSDALRLNSRTSSWNYLRGDKSDGVVKLYKSNSQRLATSDTGITVTGEVAATQDYPNFRPTLDLNFAAEKKLDPRVVYYRSGPASFTDEFGKVVVVGDNTPRFDHDPVSGESKGLLIETLRTNQWLYSEDLVTYVTGGNLQESTLANTTATTDPRGGTNAVLMAATTAGGAHSFYKNFTSGSNGDVHTFSVWVKAAGVDYARIYVDTVGGNMNGPGVTFSTKNVWNVSATGVATQTRTSVDEYPNGWWRLSVSGSFSNRNDYFCHVDLEGGEADVAFNGNGSDGMYVWGAQFETGSYPSSYIPTNGGVVERGFDNVVIDEEDFTDFYNPLESSVLAVGTVKRPVSAQGQLNIFHVGDSNQDGHGVFREHGTKDIFYHIRNGNATPTGGNLVASGYGDWSEGREAKIAIAFKDGDQAISVNGGNQATATVTSSYPTNNITKMWIGSASGNGSGQFEGTIKRIAYYSKLLTDNQLNTLTA